jgi:hypothetical protein
MKRIALAMIFSLLATLGVSYPIAADTAFAPSEDSICYVFLPDTPLDGMGLFADYTYNAGVGFGTGYRTYMKFNLNNLTGTVGSTVKIRLYTLIPAIAPFGISIYSVDDGWNESSLTWNNSATHPPLIELDRKLAPTTAGTYIEFTGASLANYINAQFSGDKIASFVIIQSATYPDSSGTDTIGFADSENLTYPPQLDPGTPTAVTLVNFEATPKIKDIQINWGTVDETNLVGFNLLRSTDPDSQRTQLNSGMIPAIHVGQQTGSDYYYVDTTVDQGVTYYYWLQTIITTGEISNFGPVQATAFHQQYLPFVER